MGMIKTLWWGYLDDKGDIHVKRYTTDKQIQNYSDFPYCVGIFEPFYAFNAEDAKQQCYVSARNNPEIKTVRKEE